jgi:4-hydroxy-L-threonine phosphate dehydrogenase PdxA
MGDPSGIGPEIILKSLVLFKHNKDIRIFGNKDILKRTAQDLGLLNNYRFVNKMMDDCTENTKFRYGKPTPKTGQVAMRSLECALIDEPDILITPPIVKEVIRSGHPGFCGHTEYLAHFFKIKDFAMVGIWRNKRIMLLTTHLPLRRVLKKITTKAVLKKIMLLDQGLKRYFGITHPSIAASALNPHGHEFSLGEDENIQKAVGAAKTRGINCSGPYPADSLFDRNYDGFLAMYHDQAMIYLKSKKNGLNFTLGLPIIRLSPLYGAALDIAGKNQAEATGLSAAIISGIRLYKNVRKYETKNN